MIPFDKINKNDYFTNPKLKGQGSILKIIAIEKSFKQFLIQPCLITGNKLKSIGKPYWITYPDHIFDESWLYNIKEKLK